MSVPRSMKSGICETCKTHTEKRGEDGRFGRFLHVGCFNAWWDSEYGKWSRGPYYRWMRQGMCAR